MSENTEAMQQRDLRDVRRKKRARNILSAETAVLKGYGVVGGGWGDLATEERLKLRKECKAVGPVGFRLESMRFQAATTDDKFALMQANQPVIKITKAPIQQLATLARQMATANRTRRVGDRRMETRDLEEINKFATGGQTHVERQNRIDVDKNSGILVRES